MKSLSLLLKGVTLNHNGGFYCLNYFYSYSTKNKFKRHEKVCNDHDCCYVEMPDEYDEKLRYSHGEKSLRAPAIIYAFSVCLKRCIHVKIILKNLIQIKKSIRLLVIQYLQVVRLIQQKTNLIVRKVKIVWNGFVKS